MSTAIDTTFNGWANWETWNVALWINNDEYLYHLAMECGDYETFVKEIGVGYSTPDGVKYNDPAIDGIEINDMIADFNDDDDDGIVINHQTTPCT